MGMEQSLIDLGNLSYLTIGVDIGGTGSRPTTLAEPLPWMNSTLLKGDAAEAVVKLKKEHDRNLVIFGSGVLVQSLMRHDLIDEYVLQIHPVILGKGRRLFPDDITMKSLSLVDSVATGTGVIIATYQPF